MACVGCGKKIQLKNICKKCAYSPWWQVDQYIGYFANLFINKHKSEYLYVLKHGPYSIPTRDEHGEFYQEELDKEYIEGLRRISQMDVKDVSFYDAYYQRKAIIDGNNFRKQWKIYKNKCREGASAPKHPNMSRVCKICKEKYPLTNEYFHSFYDVKEMADFYKPVLFGRVCRKCYSLQIEAMKNLKKLGFGNRKLSLLNKKDK